LIIVKFSTTGGEVTFVHVLIKPKALKRLSAFGFMAILMNRTFLRNARMAIIACGICIINDFPNIIFQHK